MNSYRSVLEVIKFLTPEDLLKATNRVTRLWSQASDSSELWWQLLETLISVPSYLQTDDPPKQRFRSLYYSSLCLIDKDDLKVFHCLSNTWTASVSLLGIDNSGTSVIVLSSGRMFYCGGGHRSSDGVANREAFVVESDGRMTQQNAMIEARRYHGLINHGPNIYVFGGESAAGKLSSCETLPISKPSRSVWRSLPNMHIKRSRMNVCLHRDQIYVCGGLHSTAEVYDTRTGLFTLLPFRLPEVTDTCCFFMENRLVVLQDNYMTVWETGSGAMGTFIIEHKKGLKASGNMNPRVIDSFVWIHPRLSNCVIRLEVTTLDMSRIRISDIKTKNIR